MAKPLEKYFDSCWFLSCVQDAEKTLTAIRKSLIAEKSCGVVANTEKLRSLSASMNNLIKPLKR